MATETDYIKELTHIRSMMERSSRFISLSGLAGVFAGIYALAGVTAAYIYLDLGAYRHYYDGALQQDAQPNAAFVLFFLIDALVVLAASLGTGIYLTTRKARKNGQKTWDKAASRLVINMAIPLVAGGIFCLALFYHQAIGLIVPATLIFYGMALLNGSKYTFNDIRYLGVAEIALGLLASFFTAYGLLLWATGFGVLHIIYGTVMYFKYEKQ